MCLNVSKLGLFNLINLGEYSCLTMGRVSIEIEALNIKKNYENYKENFGEEKAFKKMIDVLNMQKIKELRGYKQKIITEDYGLSTIMPNGDSLKFITIKGKAKENYVNCQLYNFLGIVLKSKKGYTKKQGILLVPLDRDEKKYVAEFLSEVIYENYFFEETTPGGRDFIFTSDIIRRKYPFLPILTHIEIA